MRNLNSRLVITGLGLTALFVVSACSSSSSGAPTTPPSDAGGGVPTLAITSPAANASVAVTVNATTATEKDIPIVFTVTNFTLTAPGFCKGDATCDMGPTGHIHVLIDGDTCTPPGGPYNNDGFASPVNAILSNCPTVNGAHTVRLELHHDDHSPYFGADGTVVNETVSLTATGG